MSVVIHHGDSRDVLKTLADACMAPRCKGKDYTGSSKAKADVEAFTAEVVDFMRKNNRRDAGKCAALVLKDANAAPCMFS